MHAWPSDAEMFAAARQELFPAVVGDVMDKMGLLHQFLPSAIRPLQDDMVVLGRAMPVLEADVYTEVGNEVAHAPQIGADAREDFRDGIGEGEHCKLDEKLSIRRQLRTGVRMTESPLEDLGVRDDADADPCAPQTP